MPGGGAALTDHTRARGDVQPEVSNELSRDLCRVMEIPDDSLSRFTADDELNLVDVIWGSAPRWGDPEPGWPHFEMFAEKCAESAIRGYKVVRDIVTTAAQHDQAEEDPDVDFKKLQSSFTMEHVEMLVDSGLYPELTRAGLNAELEAFRGWVTATVESIESNPQEYFARNVNKLQRGGIIGRITERAYRQAMGRARREWMTKVVTFLDKGRDPLFSGADGYDWCIELLDIAEVVSFFGNSDSDGEGLFCHELQRLKRKLDQGPAARDDITTERLEAYVEMEAGTPNPVEKLASRLAACIAFLERKLPPDDDRSFDEKKFEIESQLDLLQTSVELHAKIAESNLFNDRIHAGEFV